MKRKIIILTCICMMIGLSACTTKKDTKVENEVIKEDDKEAIKEEDTPNVSENSLIEVTTSFFSVSVPKSWENDYIYEIRSYEYGSYSLSFHDKVSYSQEGGWLFNIDVLPLTDNYKEYNPNYEELGSIKTSDGNVYNLIISEPTDVQFSDETAKSYREKKELTEQICKSLKMENGCVFDENVKETSEVAYEYSESEVNTPYYSLKLPELWVTEGFYKIICKGNEAYSIGFYNSENYNRGDGGSLFSIGMYEETEETDFPSCKDLGKIKLKNGKVYKLFALFPTDVQYSSEMAASYRNMEELRDGVIDTFDINEEFRYNQ